MYTLEQLQELGAINGSLRTLDAPGVLPYQEALGLSDVEQSLFDGTIVVDGCKWVATVSAIPVAEAAFVYSSDGECVGMFNRKKRTFYIMQLQGDTLVTTKSFNLKEGYKMPETQLNINMDEIEEAMNSVGATGTQEIDAFNKDGGAKDPKDMTDKEIRAQEKKKFYDGVRAQYDADDTIGAPDEVLRNNRKFGRLFGFVTATDPAVKLSVRKAAKLVDGKRVPLPGADEKYKEDAAKGKAIPLSQCEKEAYFAFQQSKPGKPKAIIVGTPAGTELALTSIGSSHAPVYDMNNQDLQIKVLGMETGYSFIAYNYGNLIRESSDVLGEKATFIDFIPTVKTKKDSPKDYDIKTIMKARDRKHLIVEGNYIPMKVFKTIGVQDPTPEERKILDLNVEAAVSRLDTDKKNMMREEDRTAYSVDAATGEYTSKWFDQGAAIVVAPYEDPDATLANVRIPARKKTANKKEKDKFTYGFEYYTMDDEEHGPLANPAYLQILKAANLSVDIFKKSLEAAVHKTKSTKSGSKINNTLSAEQFLRGLAGRDQKISEKSIIDLQNEIDGLALLG